MNEMMSKKREAKREKRKMGAGAFHHGVEDPLDRLLGFSLLAFLFSLTTSPNSGLCSSPSS